MPFSIVQEDITTMRVDAIVNAANPGLVMGGGVCGAIFRAAGAQEMEKACRPLAPIAVGEAVITPGFALPAKYVIHTAGPVYQGGSEGEADLLRASYLNSLRLALQQGCTSIAFPLISSGIYGYPKREALDIATAAIRDFLAEHDLEIYLAVLNRQAVEIEEELLAGLASYAAEEREGRHAELLEERAESHQALYSYVPVRTVDSLLADLEESFAEALFRLIDAKGRTDVEVYKRANLDRRHFSKIRSNRDYVPSKRTVLALAIALELSLEETEILLKKAGYALSPSQMFDVIVQYFIIHGMYDVYAINEVLFSYGLPLLGSVGKGEKEC
ncbi:MAG TPA: macro domain-containing protein [Firmicutes bacterium]|jgi:O-acetyl-ADP-ribose deacetylase (regulator of RNase III)|nr:macro domain-containing protein [Bacillota bacterium]